MKGLPDDTKRFKWPSRNKSSNPSDSKTSKWPWWISWKGLIILIIFWIFVVGPITSLVSFIAEYRPIDAPEVRAKKKEHRDLAQEIENTKTIEALDRDIKAMTERD